MGYYSKVALKTTTEGYILLKRFNDIIEKYEDKPFYALAISKTSSGFYKLSRYDIKWYDSNANVRNFYMGLDILDKNDVPYVFIRVGEEPGDIEIKNNYTDDMPEELETFRPDTNIYDDDEGHYEEVTDEDWESAWDDELEDDDSLVHIDAVSEDMTPENFARAVLFQLFDMYKYNEDIEDALTKLLKAGKITKPQYDLMEHMYNDVLAEWEEA